VTPPRNVDYLFKVVCGESQKNKHGSITDLVTLVNAAC